MPVLGIDEVGRGPLAGPLVVGAVVLPRPWPDWVSELRDSKVLSAKRRESLAAVILRESAVGLGWVSVGELDAIGISKALRLATRRAVKEVQGTGVAFSQIVIDGKVNFLSETALSGYVTMMPKADEMVKEVSAASIVAKVARDKYMFATARRFTEYGFETNVGYGTAKHLAAIHRFGICPEHRKCFEPIRSMLGYVSDGASEDTANVVKNTTMIGGRGESAVCEYLTQCGHEIVMRNFKTRFCEIDIVTTCDDKLYFTEVKYRKTNVAGGGLAAITAEKRRRMKFAAEMFLKYYERYRALDPLLAVANVDGENFTVEDWFPLEF